MLLRCFASFAQPFGPDAPGTGMSGEGGVVSWVLSTCMDTSATVAVKATVETDVGDLGFGPAVMNHLAAAEVGVVGARGTLID
jgi:hypothetical protein